VNFKIVKIDNIAFEKLFNLLIFKSIREKLFKNNMLIFYLPNKISQFNAVKYDIINCMSEFDFYQVSSPYCIFFIKVVHDGKILTNSHSKALPHRYRVFALGWLLFSSKI
jgi:hypothetical protein